MRYFNISDVGSVSFAVCIRMTLNAVLSERSAVQGSTSECCCTLWTVGGGERCRSKTNLQAVAN